MKKFIVICLMFVSVPIYAEDEVNLDINITEIKKFNTGSLDFGNSENTDFDDEEKYIKPKDTFNSIKNLFVEDFCSPKKEIQSAVNSKND